MLELILARVGSEEQLEREAFKMAAGGERGCSLASDPELLLRQLWKDYLEAQDLSEPGLLDAPQKASLRHWATSRRRFSATITARHFFLLELAWSRFVFSVLL